jgi:hypothetical protein
MISHITKRFAIQTLGTFILNIFDPVLHNPVDDKMTPFAIFLSYAHKDRHYRKQVQKALEKRELSVWVDDRGIAPGVAWQEAIQDAIDSACCIVVILSPDAKSSRYVSRELNYANSQGKRIFPVLARGNAKKSVPFVVSGIQFVNIAKKSKAEFDEVMDTLAEAIQAHLKAGCPSE